ncbi:hypothetical protein AYM40_32125 [Paraburkholderia phytofirmans OLGA172]|uniref:Uncharacterized protein n=2 Tax=Paraburkholderia phytofirmans TaxID=261302 RepID=A0A160FU98_9BURK|nr:hypothetical protein AYM40_32125 [Paraburkholderia phytofirmans OLGA172]
MGSRRRRKISNSADADSLFVFDPQHQANGDATDENDLTETENKIVEPAVRYDAITGMLINLMFSMQKKAIEKLIDALPGSCRNFISKGHKLAALYRSLWEIHRDNNSGLSGRLEAMISVIENHGELLPDSVVALKSWLVLASDALLLKDINLGRAMSGSLQDILSRTRTLLENEALQSLLPEKYVEQFVYLLDQCSLASGLIAKLKNLPEGASFADYLQLFKSDQILRNIVPESLLELADFAEKIKTRIERLDKEVLGFLPVYPDQGGYSEKLEWLIEVLSSQRVQRELGPYLDSRWMALFRTPAALMHFFQTYPVEAGALEKLHWIAAQAAASNEARPFEGTLLEPVLLNLQRSLVDGKDVRPVIDMIMSRPCKIQFA